MNVIFIEPTFPYNQREFARGLAEAGATVVGIGERPKDWLDGQMNGKHFILGARFTLVDIVLLVGLDFGTVVGQPLDPALTNLARWRARMAERPSVALSLLASEAA